MATGRLAGHRVGQPGGGLLGPETAIRQVVLTQLRYDLLTEPNPFPQPYFPMDGNRYNYNVRPTPRGAYPTSSKPRARPAHGS